LGETGCLLRSINPVKVDERIEGMDTAQSVSWIVAMADKLCDSRVYDIVKLQESLLGEV
jgi:hypothetical protein